MENWIGDEGDDNGTPVMLPSRRRRNGDDSGISFPSFNTTGAAETAFVGEVGGVDTSVGDDAPQPAEQPDSHR